MNKEEIGRILDLMEEIHLAISRLFEKLSSDCNLGWRGL